MEKTNEPVTERETTNFPSRYAVREKVSLCFDDNIVIMDCEIDAVKFTESKVWYDVKVPLFHSRKTQEKMFTYLENVDSICLIDNITFTIN